MIAKRYWNTAGAGVLAALAVAGCASTPQPPQPPPAAAPPQFEASYDWHGLLLVPFGSVLKDVPFTLHEVLLFREAAHAPVADEAECYAMEQTAPRLVARTPSEYMLCFKHDHLARVQATVNLPQSEAAQTFSDACSVWHRNEGAGHQGAGHPAAGVPGAAQPGAPQPDTAQPGACEGRDGAISYSGRLDQEADQTDVALTVTLDTAVQP